MIPKDPFILLSWINMQLRDYYPTLAELCKTLNLDQREIERVLGGVDFRYDAEKNCFL